MTQHKKGFTIVELLIVIVVIAILAAISIVAYNGIQQRAFNASMVSQAKQTYQILQLYVAGKDTALPGGALCATVEIHCTRNEGTVITASNASLLAAMREFGEPVRAVEDTLPDKYGLYYDNWAPRTYNGGQGTALLVYWLRGDQQDCVLTAVRHDPVLSSNMVNAPANQNWTGNGSNITTCYVSIPGSKI